MGVVFVLKGQVLDDDPFDITAGKTGWFYIIEDKELQPNPWLISVKSVVAVEK